MLRATGRLPCTPPTGTAHDPGTAPSRLNLTLPSAAGTSPFHEGPCGGPGHGPPWVAVRALGEGRRGAHCGPPNTQEAAS